MKNEKIWRKGIETWLQVFTLKVKQEIIPGKER